MKVEKILKKIPMFKNLKLDTILFESKYPVLFTCVKENEVYLFSCCLVTAKIMKWIGTKTDYDTLIQLLQDKLTIREAFLNVSEEKIIIEYNGHETNYIIVDKNSVPSELLPTSGEYMDAEEDEFAEEIATFKERNNNIEFRIQPMIGSYYLFKNNDKNIVLPESFYMQEEKFHTAWVADIKRISDYCVAYM